ncbi:hypothetical protein PoB_007072700 [Plakobranchus ocellatus]|uniref:Uncharacterized protein n=1 Tax=Plakobranchus ocellatus TaxID=259542 RepID=A0AAV4DIY1_9GAST|nr:hypothetical protein PoB_007072700 [Plakobranchus ocellatus]
MDNQRGNREGTSPDHLEENPVFHSSHVLSPARGYHPRVHRSDHHHYLAGTGPRYQTWDRYHSHRLHAGPHYMLQMSTQNSQRRFHSTGSFQVLPPAFQRAFPNPGQPSAQRQHQRSHRRTFQQPRNNRNQSRAIGHQLSEVNFQISLVDENASTAMQLDLRHHRLNRHRHHHRGHNHHLPAARYPRTTSTQFQPQNSQQTQVQPASTESTGQREAMAQTQPLPSDRRARTQSHSVSSQELSVQPTPSNSMGEHEAMAPQQSLISQPHQPLSDQSYSQPDNRHGDEVGFYSAFRQGNYTCFSKAQKSNYYFF